MERFYHLPTDTEGTFHSEIYYINLATQMGIKWGTDSKVRLFDPASRLHIEIGTSGAFNIRVTDSRRLPLKVVGTTGSLGQAELLGSGSSKGMFRDLRIKIKHHFYSHKKRPCAPSKLMLDKCTDMW